jgi:hypothetical protein
VSLRKRIQAQTAFTIRCSYCGHYTVTTSHATLDDAACFFERSGWKPHPRSILAVLCQRCATLYPDTIAIDRDIDTEMPF